MQHKAFPRQFKITDAYLFCSMRAHLKVESTVEAGRPINSCCTLKAYLSAACYNGLDCSSFQLLNHFDNDPR